jgi:hypothetical protein
MTPFGRTMAVGSTQPLTEMSTRNISRRGGGLEDGRCVGLTTLPPYHLNLLEPSGPVKACIGSPLPLLLLATKLLCHYLLEQGLSVIYG